MICNLHGGLLLAIIAMAFGKTASPGEVRADCDASTQGCAVDERSVEVQGVDLLQMKVNLLMDHAQMVSAASHAPVVQDLFTASQAISKTEVHKVALHIESSLYERSWSREAQSLSLAASTVTQSAREAVGSANAIRMFGLGGLFISVLLCVCLVHSQRSSRRAQQRRSPGVSQHSSDKSDKSVPTLDYMIQDTRSAGSNHFEREGGPGPANVGSASSILHGTPMMRMAGSMLMSGTTSFVAHSPNPASADRISSVGSLVADACLPPLCPSLILPNTQARFMIPIDNLMTAAGELDMQVEHLDIRGTSGRKLLHGAVSETPEGRRCLALASCGCDEDPRVTVLAPPRNDSIQRGISGGLCGTMELYGKNGKFYGTLEPAASAGAWLRHNGEFVMSLEMASSDLRMTASSVDGRRLAWAGKNVASAEMRQLESHDMWKVTVEPNLDAVLISSCMLAALLFK